MRCIHTYALMSLLIAILAITTVRAASKPLSCMSFMEDEKFLQDDYDSDEEVMYDETYNKNSLKMNIYDKNKTVMNTWDPTRPQLRICQSDYTFCFSLWRQNSNGIKIQKQGCWKESTERNATCRQHTCTSSAPTARNDTLYYCCCSGEACNEHVSIVEPAPLQLSKDFSQRNAASAAAARNYQRASFVWSSLLFLCALVIFIVVMSVLVMYIYRRKMLEKPVSEEAPLSPTGPGYSSNMRNVDNINLICVLDCGKFGSVMKGVLHDKEVAVKIYPQAHYQYYINERNIYTLPFMDCPALLSYLGYDERQTIEGKMEYQLVLSLAPLGCLQDYITANTLDFSTFCGMVKSITRGLSHLHTEIRAGDDYKPCVTHRDLNSRNVLVKADRKCCISDFGFALKVFGAKYEYKGEIAIAETKSINEVGTLRYMSPELLEGAVNLRDCETSLKQMDVYALSLILWEVSMRCVDFYPSTQLVPPYKAPYESEVGTHPTFDLMQTYVVRRKVRPLFPGCWPNSAAGRLLRDTCEDCWDHDAEARLTSLCAEERMHELAYLRPRGHLAAHTNCAILNANNLSESKRLAADGGEQSQRSYDEVDTNQSSVMSPAATAMILQPPPNQQIVPPHIRETQTEKNQLVNEAQQPLQPYHGRNPCQERNLAPITVRPPQKLVAKSNKHSFQPTDLSCIEDDVSVEELFIGVGSSSSEQLTPRNTTNMGQGFPKQQNTERTLRGWHSVRALIQKKLFRSELKKINAMNGTPKLLNAQRQQQTQLQQQQQNKRPNNLDLSPIITNVYELQKQPQSQQQQQQQQQKVCSETVCAEIVQRVRSQQSIHTIPEAYNEVDTQDEENNSASKLSTRNTYPSSYSLTNGIQTHDMQNKNNFYRHYNSNTMCNNNNNNLNNNETWKTATLSEAQYIKRQRSFEVFREVFSGRGSTEKLRDPSQRVKTPGDVPPSVRKVRASKTLSLYDDRMMDSSALNIL